jgi:hypothetical protein
LYFITIPYMEKIKFNIAAGKQVYHFELAEYPHHEDERCKFEVFLDGEMIAGFEPDRNEIVRLCKNPGKVELSILHLIAEHLEAYQV